MQSLYRRILGPLSSDARIYRAGVAQRGRYGATGFQGNDRFAVIALSAPGDTESGWTQSMNQRDKEQEYGWTYGRARRYYADRDL